MVPVDGRSGTFNHHDFLFDVSHAWQFDFSLYALKLCNLGSLDDLVDFAFDFDDLVVELGEVGVEVVDHFLNGFNFDVQGSCLLTLDLHNPALQFFNGFLVLQAQARDLLVAFRHLGDSLAFVLNHVAHNHLQLLLFLHDVFVHLLQLSLELS